MVTGEFYSRPVIIGLIAGTAGALSLLGHAIWLLQRALSSWNFCFEANAPFTFGDSLKSLAFTTVAAAVLLGLGKFVDRQRAARVAFALVTIVPTAVLILPRGVPALPRGRCVLAELWGDRRRRDGARGGAVPADRDRRGGGGRPAGVADAGGSFDRDRRRAARRRRMDRAAGRRCAVVSDAWSRTVVTGGSEQPFMTNRRASDPGRARLGRDVAGLA